MNQSFVVLVPATSGNLGPGFDVLGMALDLYNELHVDVISDRPGAPQIVIEGEGAATLPRDEKNIIYQTIEFVFKKAKRKCPQLKLTCVNRIPLTRGLGSSSSASLSGLLAGNRLLKDFYRDAQILNWASAWEGHPDNVAPALLGGVVASGVFDDRVISASWPVPNLTTVVAIPTFELSTKKARAVLPKKIDMKKAIQNLSMVALMPRAFQSSVAWMDQLFNDQWHEPYRAKLVPGFETVKKAALAKGARGVILSGAGPTMLSFCEKKNVKRIGVAMKSAFRRSGVQSRVMELSINTKGAWIR